MSDFSLQRLNMVESQVRPSDITDRRIVRAMSEVERETFVPAARRAVAYMDDAVAVAPGRALLAPRTFAKLVQLAEVPQAGVALDVGTATGYSAAVLAHLAARVVAVEPDPVLAERARRALAECGHGNVLVHVGAGPDGRPNEAPFDAIVIEGAVPEVPTSLIDQLKDGGRLVAVVSEGGMGKAVVWTRSGMAFDVREAFDAAAPALPGFERRREFAL